jgi:tRNA (mo5U34)-methyltransferase
MNHYLLSEEEVHAAIRSVPNWYHQIEVSPGIVTPGINQTAESFARFQFPEDCTGLRVLDLGTRDGYFAFEMEKRGAEVLAVDYFPADKTGFSVAANLLRSKVTYLQANIYDLTPAKHGTFDIVLILGLLYHLPDPMLALSLCRKLCKSRLYLETQTIDHAFLQPDGTFANLVDIHPSLTHCPIMQFYPKDSLNHDHTNYWAPNEICMTRMLEETLFEVVRKQTFGPRAIFECRVILDHRLHHFDLQSRGIVR